MSKFREFGNADFWLDRYGLSDDFCEIDSEGCRIFKSFYESGEPPNETNLEGLDDDLKMAIKTQWEILSKPIGNYIRSPKDVKEGDAIFCETLGHGVVTKIEESWLTFNFNIHADFDSGSKLFLSTFLNRDTFLVICNNGIPIFYFPIKQQE